MQDALNISTGGTSFRFLFLILPNQEISDDLLLHHFIFIRNSVNTRRLVGGMRNLLITFFFGTYLLTTGLAYELVQCPTISNGDYPNCECKYGPAYDNETNTCPNPECPFDNSTGVYPKCTCLQKNFDYSDYLNECFRVCPDNSTGYWPQCNCDSEGYVFVKSLFECVACPVGSSGQYPDCECDDADAIYREYDNFCAKCEDGSSGTYPNCICSNGGFYDTYNHLCSPLTIFTEQPALECQKNEGDEDSASPCIKCPFLSSGTYPNCVCDENGIYDETNNMCNQCPFRSVGVFPNCVCEGNGVYNETNNQCMECPFDSDGVYPNCVCQGPGSGYIEQFNWCQNCPADSIGGNYPNCACKQQFDYDKDQNVCVGCPENSSGVHPNCECKNGYFSKTHGICIECPTDSIGFYPNCACNDEKTSFSAYINKCYRECPDNIDGIHPNCRCDVDYYYDVSEFMCKTIVGRKCPLNSIGIGPDCLCMQEKKKFEPSTWTCSEVASAGGFGIPASSCPDGEGKWPQCPASIDRNVLLSAVG